MEGQQLPLLLLIPRVQWRARSRTETQPIPVPSVKELGVFHFHSPHFRHEHVIFWVRYISTTSVGNSTCFSMSLMVSSEALSFDFFSLFIALVRTFRKESLALLVFCLASFTSISLCSLVTLIKDKEHSTKSSHTLTASQEFNITLPTSSAVCNFTLCRWRVFTFLTHAHGDAQGQGEFLVR